MIPYPEIDPVAFSIGPLSVRWYGLMYLVGFAGAYYLCSKRAAKPNSGWTRDDVENLIFYGAIGVVVGARVGYMLFYQFPSLLSDPISMLKVWEGGMSFHGGLLGVCLAVLIFAIKQNRRFFDVLDFGSPMVPIGLGAGRIGNFIGGELWGRSTDVPWAMVFPRADNLPRHPSQLYEFALEGVVLFLILFWFSSKPRPRMAVAACFLLFYGIFRFLVEFTRQPDAHLGFIAFGWLSMGQLLCVPMILGGIGMLAWAYKFNPTFEEEYLANLETEKADKAQSAKKESTKNKKKKSSKKQTA